MVARQTLLSAPAIKLFSGFGSAVLLSPQLLFAGTLQVRILNLFTLDSVSCGNRVSPGAKTLSTETAETTPSNDPAQQPDAITAQPAAEAPPSEPAAVEPAPQPEAVAAAPPTAAPAAPPEAFPAAPPEAAAAASPEAAAAVPDDTMDMQALLDSEAGQQTQLRRGEIVKGMVMGASSDGVIVDVGAKTEAVIPPAEMLSLGAEAESKLSTGDEVKVMIMQPSSAEGHAVVSLDRARGEEGWDVLEERHESGEIFGAEIVGHNRGGLLVNVEGVNAFVPLSQVDSLRRDDPQAITQLATLVGNTIQLKVLELNRRKNRAILSERAAMSEWRKEQKERVLGELQEGEIRDGRVSSITDFGVFVDLGGADGLAHMTELTWERGKKARDLFKVGDEVKAYVLKVDLEGKKISLSLKRAHPEEWDNAVDRFVIGQILIGRVTKLMPFGAFVRLEGPVEGLVHISEMTNRRIQHPKEVVKENDVVPVKLVRIEKDRHRLGLSLRQARNDAEAMGFAFSREGAVVDWPDDVREDFDLGERNEEQQRMAQPKTAAEAIERAVSRDPEPVSAFAHAFAQALENADEGSPFAVLDTSDAQESADADALAQEEVVAEAPTEEAAGSVAEAPAEESTDSVAEAPAEESTAEVTAEVAEAPAVDSIADVSVETENSGSPQPSQDSTGVTRGTGEEENDDEAAPGTAEG